MAKSSQDNTTPEMEASSDDSSQGEASNDSNEIEEDSGIASLNTLLELVDQPETFLHTLLLPPESLPADCDDDDGDTKNSHSSQVKTLHNISRVLFSRMEQLAGLQERLEKNGVESSTESNTTLSGDDEVVGNLSGLAELYVGSVAEKEDEEIITVDTETIWGQVDIQNMALFSRLKKTIRKLKKNIHNKEVGGKEYLRLLDSEVLGSDDERQNDDNSDEGDSDDTSVEENNTEKDHGLSDEDEVDDEDAKRIKQRMERAMADMDNSSDENTDGEEEDEQEITSPSEIEKEADLPDPAREELNDGFFDLHEMEEFADQEEEMLPDEASVEKLQDADEKMKLRKKNLPHLRARNGEEGDSEDEEFDSLMKQVEPSKTRTRFRPDDDINALEIMYEDGDDQDEDDDADAVNVTAATFFGQPKKPSKEYHRKLKDSNSANNTKVKKQKVSFIDENPDEADSWNDHDFTEGEDWRGKDTEDTVAHREDDDNNHILKDGAPSEAEKKNTQEEDIVDTKEAEKLSRHAIHAKKLNELTKKLEEEALAEKPWQMVGESKGSQRPVNSLLDTTADFEFATKLAPIITVEHTTSIEEIIKQRILAEDWDDVIPRELPDIGLSKRNGELPEVSQEKSKLSLGELYEREYLKKAVGYDADAVEKETEEGQAKNELKMLFANLCSKLDALSNYHFAPRPVADEADVKTSATPAIAMEEVLPLHVSDAQVSAPEEIYAKKKGRESIVRGESEMDQVNFHYLSLFVQCLF